MKKTEKGDASIRSACAVDYQGIISVINEGVIIMQDGKIVFANPSFSQLTGKSIPEVMGISFGDLVSSRHRDEVMEFVNAVGKEGEQQTRIELQLDGTPGRLVDMKAGVIRYGGRKAILGWLTDITERRKKTLETQRLHRRLRSILDSMHHVVLSFSFNEADDKVKVRDASFYDEHLVEINPAAEALYGVPREEFLTKKRSIFDLVHEEDKEKVLHHYRNLHREGSGELTYRLTRPDNEVRWVLDYGKVEYREKNRVRRVNRIVEDITPKRKALDDLKASERKYRRIFERSKDMIYILGPDGSFIDINPAGLELLGLGSKEEAALRNIKEFHVDPRASDALLKELMEKGEVIGRRVMLWKNRGEIIEVDLNAIAKRDNSGKVVSYQGIVTNITEALRQKELESIGQLAGCFADDLTSPLNLIMMNLSVTKVMLEEIKETIKKASYGEKALSLSGLGEQIQPHVEEIGDFNNASIAACKQIAARLKEIREEYWRLKKVPDGTGGIIYERHSKWGPKGDEPLV